MLVHQLRAPFGRVGDLRAERAVVLPALAALDVEIEVGVEEGAQRAFDRRLAARSPHRSRSSAYMRGVLVTTARRANTASNSFFLSTK